ncbi:MAG: 3-phosphoshikimate 1-carboxyvinyltransferase [Candidatus Omnitrophica bacterium]|nr:3-phosphoshikimate 1-carboxyvinyltransferase [Candidatus Omnitrophota bacterium]
MKITVYKTTHLKGNVLIPSSKSHTIRAVIISSLADGVSEIENALISSDTTAAVEACRSLGAEISVSGNKLTIRGFNGVPQNPSKTLDMANSGTSLNLILGIVSLGNFETVLDGDESLRSRPVNPLLDALNRLGAKGESVLNNGKPPIKIRGKIKGGMTKVDGMSSQFVSSLLISTPLCENDTEIDVFNIHETPYIDMTITWLKEQNIRFDYKKDFSWFRVYGKQTYKHFKKRIPGDWSSAAFPIVAGAITGSDIFIAGVDVNDVQGDKAIVEYLRKMGADITMEQNGLRIRGCPLKGADIDLNATPDALPAMAVAGCFAKGETKLYNVAQARIKETDRIKVMTGELRKMGADVKELKDGLVLKRSSLRGAKVNGHYDHRVVMALSLAGLIAEGETEIDTAESVNVTFPGYCEMMQKIEAKINIEEEGYAGK